MNKCKLSIIVACALNRGIGKDNKLLWHLPADMKLFRMNTVGRAVVMGRRTAESIGKALPNRRNIVVTSGDAPFEGVEVVRSLREAMDLVTEGELCVIGGERLYAEALPLAQCVKLTLVHDHPEADAFFPPFDPQQYTVRDTCHVAETDEGPAFTYTEYLRNEQQHVGTPEGDAGQQETDGNADNRQAG